MPGPSFNIDYYSNEELRARFRQEIEQLVRHTAELIERRQAAESNRAFQRGVVWYKEVDGKFQIFLDKNGWCQQNINGEGAWVDVSEEDATERNLRGWAGGPKGQAEMPVGVTWFEEDDVGSINIRTMP